MTIAPLTDRSSCLAVVPAYNEQATVAKVVASLHAKTPQLDVVVIDDGSTDATAECAERAGARVLRMPFNVGIGGAVQAGFKFAEEQGYDYMVQVDGDGQHDPAEISKLFSALDGPKRADMICGSRFATATGYIAPVSRRAHSGSRNHSRNSLHWSIGVPRKNFPQAPSTAA